MPTAAEEQEVASSYSDELADLTFNSKPIINSLTMIADESAAFSSTIADIILERIAAAPAEKKLPIIYLLDSISKNVRREYLAHFAARLPETIGGAFAASGPKVRASLHKLLKTWTGVFPQDVLTRVAERFATAESAPVVSAASNGAAAPAQPQAPAAAATRKRTRVDVGDGMRLELKGLTARIHAHVSTGLPADTQLLKFVGQAVALNEALLDQAAPGAAARAQIQAELASLCARRATIVQQLQAEGIPIPSGAGAPPPPPRAVHAPPPPPAGWQAPAQPAAAGPGLPPLPNGWPPHMESHHGVSPTPPPPPPPPPQQQQQPQQPPPTTDPVDLPELYNALKAAGYFEQSREAAAGGAAAPLAAAAGASAYGACCEAPSAACGLGSGLLSQPGGMLSSLGGGRGGALGAGALGGMAAGVMGSLGAHLDRGAMAGSAMGSAISSAMGGGMGGALGSAMGGMGMCVGSGCGVLAGEGSGSDRAVAAAVHSLYGSNRQQCSACGLRFGPESSEDYSEHMAWHSRVEAQAGVKGAPLLSRRWLAGLDEWLAAPPAREAGLQQASAFDSARPAGEAEALAVSADATIAPPRVDLPAVRAPRDTSRVECCSCGEDIPIWYDPDRDDWFLRDAIDTGGGHFQHAACAQ